VHNNNNNNKLPLLAVANGLLVVGYLIFELPAALIVKVFQPNLAYGFAVIAFGVLATSMTAVRSYAPIMVIRTFLGFTEAFVQTGFLFLTLWYRREEVTTRTGTSVKELNFRLYD
jgi:hypothetical protein